MVVCRETTTFFCFNFVLNFSDWVWNEEKLILENMLHLIFTSNQGYNQWYWIIPVAAPRNTRCVCCLDCACYICPTIFSLQAKETSNLSDVSMHCNVYCLADHQVAFPARLLIRRLTLVTDKYVNESKWMVNLSVWKIGDDRCVPFICPTSYLICCNLPVCYLVIAISLVWNVT